MQLYARQDHNEDEITFQVITFARRLIVVQ